MSAIIPAVTVGPGQGPSTATKEPRAVAVGPADERTAGAGGAGPLDTYANNPPGGGQRAERRRSRLRARRVLWRESSLKRVRACGRTATDAQGVALVVSEGAPGERIAGYRGVATCGSVWACPRCSVVIAERRAQELREGLSGWGRRGGAVVLLTLTMRHHRGQSLDELWDGLASTWSRLMAGRPWKAFKAAAGLVGTLRVVEVTHGAAGWHAHIHALLFLDPAQGRRFATVGGADSEFEAHFAAISARVPVLASWRNLLRGRGFDAVEAAQDMRPVSLSAAGTELDRYFTKGSWDAAAEVTKGPSKRGSTGSRTPMQILADFVATGDADDLDLWREWEAGSERRRQMTWSRGFKRELGLTDVSDEEVAAEHRGDEAVLMLSALQWRVVRESALYWLLLERAEACDDLSELGGWLDSAAERALVDRPRAG
ncbi:protein rep [Flexivirga meconopsidis]|uniref:protein rep n=1 Tax=Flexivirga meconopsidis TaxID=2977121 RepID=UPI00313444B6